MIKITWRVDDNLGFIDFQNNIDWLVICGANYYLQSQSS